MDFYSDLLLQNLNGGSSLLQSANLSLKKCLENTLVTITGNMLDGVSEIRAYAFYKCDHLERVEIPSSVENIGNYSFMGCTGLEYVTIQQGVTNIGESAFSGCSSLKSVTVLATIPPTLNDNVFTNTPSDFLIYVPAESVDAYKSASMWSSYASQIQAILEVFNK